MPDDGLGHIGEAPAGDPPAHVEVDVLIEGEVALVIAAQLVKHRAPEEAGRTTDSKDLADRRGPTGSLGLPRPELDRPPITKKSLAHAVEVGVAEIGPWLLELEDARLHTAEARIGLQGIEQPSQAAWLQLGVNVQHQHRGGAGARDAEVHGGGKADVLRQGNVGNSLPLQVLERAVSGSVIHDEQLDLRLLALDRGQAARQQIQRVPAGNHNRHRSGPSHRESLTRRDHASVPPVSDALAIQVEGLHKSFRIPTHRVDSLKERVVRPFAARDYRELKALDGVSFEIEQGEFFGIVGRNGSGKSTLLKLLASIYRADSGTIRLAGRLAPFIELGVGFNAELSARENVVLNGVMMGLTPQESRNRLDAVIEFAELEEFVDLKLKNYSSGMMVRLAFSLMLEVDADVLLIDEVLAVGDAAFQQKCADAFREMKAAGKTIILVTHQMTTVEEYCHRAMLINDGHLVHVGEPEEVGRRYLRLNFEQAAAAEVMPAAGPGEDAPVRMLDARIVNSKGERVTSVEHGEQIRIEIEIEARRDFAALSVGYLLVNADGVGVCQIRAPIGGDPPPAIKAGERLEVATMAPNLLGPGHYFVHCGINRLLEGGVALDIHNALDFVVFGGAGDRGVVTLPQSTTTSPIEGTSR